MSPEERALLEDIAADPANDGLRLVYADWLEDRGTPESAARAEFIRSQLGRVDDVWTNRERDLLADHGERWAAPLYQRGLIDHEAPLGSCHFRRGMIEGVGPLDHDLFFTRGGEWLDVVPTITEVHFRYKVPFAQLAACPHLGRVRGLNFRVWVESDDVKALLSSPHLRSLSSLNLSLDEAGLRHLANHSALRGLQTLALGYRNNPPVVETLSQSKHLRLTRLSLGGNKPSREAIRLLASHDTFAGLTELDLRNGELGADAARDLALGNRLAQIRRLGLSETPIGDTGLEAIVATAAQSATLENLRLSETGVTFAGRLDLGVLGRLRSLDLSENHLGDRLTRLRPLRELRALFLDDTGLTANGLRSLLAGQPFPSLESLQLGNNPFGDKGAAVLAEWLPPSVRFLDLSVTGLTSAGVALLANSPRLANVESLYLHNNQIGREGAKHLAQSPHLRKLSDLMLSACRIGRQGLASLLESAVLSGIGGLSLGDQPLGDAGAKLLARCEGLSRLRFLDLEKTGLGDAGTVALAESPHLSRLASLYLGGNNIGSAGASALARSPHLSRLFWLHLQHNPLKANGLRALVHAKLPRLRRVDVSSDPCPLLFQFRERFPN